MYSKTVMVGRLTKDPNSQFTNNGKQVTKFSIAVDRDYKGADGNKQTDFFNVVAWGKTAEICGKYLKKGGLTLVDGRMETRKYQNNEGQMVYITELNCEKMQMLGNKNEGNGAAPAEKEAQQDDGAGYYNNYEDVPF